MIKKANNAVQKLWNFCIKLLFINIIKQDVKEQGEIINKIFEKIEEINFVLTLPLKKFHDRWQMPAKRKLKKTKLGSIFFILKFARLTIMVCSISLQTCALIIIVFSCSSVNADWEKIGERIYNKISKTDSPQQILSHSSNGIHFNFRKWNRTQH